jgi:hypothetical protein
MTQALYANMNNKRKKNKQGPYIQVMGKKQPCNKGLSSKTEPRRLGGLCKDV